MKIIDWNICCMGSPDSKIQFLESVLGNDSFIAILQEVTPLQYDFIKSHYSNIRYSLDYRNPGAFDTDNRRLGIAVICSDDIIIKTADVLNRSLLPERTLMVDVEYNAQDIRIIGLHSVVGAAFKMAKSMQFRSWAEAIVELKPDIVAFDANEPAKDHYDIEKMNFFSQFPKENGSGARTFFTALIDTGLVDTYSVNYDSDNYVEEEPLVMSHYISKGNQRKRYDFIFMNKTVSVARCEYMYNEAVKAGSDHALICCSYL